MTTRLSELDVTPGELTRLAAESDAWVAGTVDGTAAWLDTATDSVIVHEATPEGVPEGYEYVAPGEEPPEDHDVVESPQGATYMSPEPTDGDADNTAEIPGNSDTAVQPGDPRQEIDSLDDARGVIDDFDKDEYPFDYWSRAREEAINEGSIIEVSDEEFAVPGDGDAAVVVSAEDGRAVMDNGRVVDFQVGPYGDGLEAVSVWDDPANAVASGEKEWDNFGEEYVPDAVKDQLPADYFESDDPDDAEDNTPESEPLPDPEQIGEQYDANVSQFDGGELSEGYAFHDYRLVDVEEQGTREVGDKTVTEYTASENEWSEDTIAVIDDVATEPRERFYPDEGETVYYSFADDAGLSDGWYEVGEMDVVDDGADAKVPLTAADGTETSVSFDAMRDGGHKETFRPRETRPLTPDNPSIHEAFDESYPEPPESVDELDQQIAPGVDAEVFDTTRGFDGQEAENVRAALAKADELNLLDNTEEIRHTDSHPRDPIGMYEVGADNLLLNPDKDTDWQRENLSPEHSVGRTMQDTVIHEAIHAAHVQELESQGQTPEEIKDDLLASSLDPLEKEIIEENVSEYGATNPLEVVAEVGTMIANGMDVPDEAMYLYEKYDGPNIAELAGEPVEQRYRPMTDFGNVDGKASVTDELPESLREDVEATLQSWREWVDQLEADTGVTAGETAMLSELDATAAEMHALSAKAGEWVPYEGPDGGEGWQNRETGEIVYDDEPPGEAADTEETRARELTNQVSDILGTDPGREDFALAEETVENATGVDNVDFSSFDRQQSETVSAELARMDQRGDLDGLAEVSSTVPPAAESEYGDLPMHYDRGGKAMSVDPQAINADVTGAMNEAGITSTPEVEHFLQHLAAAHKHTEAIENGETEPEGDPSESAEQQLEEDTDVDTAELAANVGQLALATGVTCAAEIYTIIQNDGPTTDQMRRAYRYFGGPALGGDDE